MVPRPAPGGGPFEGPSGPAQGGPCNVVSPADSSGGARLSLEESRRKEHQGGERFSPPWTHLSLVFARREVVFFLSYLACGPVSHARNGPPPSWAGWEGWFRGREGFFPPPKPSPRGEGGPAKPGRMRGRFGTQPFLVEIKKGAPGCRPDGVLLLPRWATRSPPHQSPSVTASPQGEASGLCSPTRKSVPNQGTQMGTETAPPPEQCATTAKTSEWERAGHKAGGRGATPATLCVRAFSRESLDPRPGPGGNPPRRC